LRRSHEYGLPDEVEALVADIRAAVRIPMVAVSRNHDFESGHPELLCRVLDDAGVNVLNGEAIEIAGVGFAGISGAAVFSARVTIQRLMSRAVAGPNRKG
jgi:Icc-related predicted phosphoesterase